MYSSFNKAVFGHYKDIMKDLYIEPMEEELYNKERDQSTSISSSKKAAITPQAPPESTAISSFFEKSRSIKSTKRQATLPSFFISYLKKPQNQGNKN